LPPSAAALRRCLPAPLAAPRGPSRPLFAAATQHLPTRPPAAQVQFSLLSIGTDQAAVKATADDLGITLIAYSPLALGLLSGGCWGGWCWDWCLRAAGLSLRVCSALGLAWRCVLRAGCEACLGLPRPRRQVQPGQPAPGPQGPALQGAAAAGGACAAGEEAGRPAAGAVGARQGSSRLHSVPSQHCCTPGACACLALAPALLLTLPAALLCGSAARRRCARWRSRGARPCLRWPSTGASARALCPSRVSRWGRLRWLMHVPSGSLCLLALQGIPHAGAVRAHWLRSLARQ
jgi:hypothetical protein